MPRLALLAVVASALAGCQSTPSDPPIYSGWEPMPGAALFIDTDDDGLPDARVVGSQQPQGKEAVAVANPMPRLADVLKGYVGQECFVGISDTAISISFTEANPWGMEATTRWFTFKLEIVGQDFLKLAFGDAGELIVPFNHLSGVTVRKP